LGTARTCCYALRSRQRATASRALTCQRPDIELAKTRRSRKDTAPKSSASEDGDFEIIVDRDQRIRQITQDAAAWCGSTPVELLGVDGRDRWPTHPQVDAAIETALSNGAASTVVYASLIAPGRWVETHVEPFDDGARIRFRDITARVLEQSRGTADDLDHPNLGEGPTEIVLLDPSGVIVSANSAWHAASATSGLQIAKNGVGATYVAVAKTALPEMDEVAFQRQFDDLVSGRSAQIAETYRLTSARGEELRHVQITPLRLGNATYFAAIHEDLTERARVLAALSDTSDQLLQAQEQERQRIAIELHDSMSQHLAAMVLGLGQLDRRVREDPDAHEIVDELSQLAQRAIKETRVLSYLMNALEDDRRGLEASVRQFVEGFGRRSGLLTTFDAEGAVDQVNAAVQHTVFRTVQEALSNVYRYARATQASVRLSSRDGLLMVRVSDDGRGIPVTLDKSAPMGVGIPGMRARIHQLGGTLDIAGDVSGTTVTASVPVAAAQAAIRASRAGPPLGV
jgi:signal transduction histidine kinase